MNDIQNNRNIMVINTKARIRSLECDLVNAREDLRHYEQRLQEAIDADRESWHNTPGILK